MRTAAANRRAHAVCAVPAPAFAAQPFDRTNAEARADAVSAVRAASAGHSPRLTMTLINVIVIT
ncbi:hypothetical protein, partial [Burkholderia thailandensis]|uniref:hypothetical protein n=1 Tax=Burkholderia thailandensis TaxID=57975 RepID=UPI0021C5DC96